MGTGRVQHFVEDFNAGMDAKLCRLLVAQLPKDM